MSLKKSIEALTRYNQDKILKLVSGKNPFPLLKLRSKDFAEGSPKSVRRFNSLDFVVGLKDDKLSPIVEEFLKWRPFKKELLTNAVTNAVKDGLYEITRVLLGAGARIPEDQLSGIIGMLIFTEDSNMILLLQDFDVKFDFKMPKSEGFDPISEYLNAVQFEKTNLLEAIDSAFPTISPTAKLVTIVNQVIGESSSLVLGNAYVKIQRYLKEGADPHAFLENGYTVFQVLSRLERRHREFEDGKPTLDDVLLSCLESNADPNEITPGYSLKTLAFFLRNGLSLERKNEYLRSISNNYQFYTSNEVVKEYLDPLILNSNLRFCASTATLLLIEGANSSELGSELFDFIGIIPNPSRLLKDLFDRPFSYEAVKLVSKVSRSLE